MMFGLGPGQVSSSFVATNRQSGSAKIDSLIEKSVVDRSLEAGYRTLQVIGGLHQLVVVEVLLVADDHGAHVLGLEKMGWVMVIDG